MKTTKELFEIIEADYNDRLFDKLGAVTHFPMSFGDEANIRKLKEDAKTELSRRIDRK